MSKIKRYDNLNRELFENEHQQKNGTYKYTYYDATGKRCAEYSWKLVSTDKVPPGKRDCLSLREKEQLILNGQFEYLKAKSTNKKRKKFIKNKQTPYYLYIISDNDNAVKIGITKDIEKRLVELQTSCPNKLTIERSLKFPDRKIATQVETLLHQYFKKYKTQANNEWFNSFVLECM